jgi:hypothetical protein
MNRSIGALILSLIAVMMGLSHSLVENSFAAQALRERESSSPLIERKQLDTIRATTTPRVDMRSPGPTATVRPFDQGVGKEIIRIGPVDEGIKGLQGSQVSGKDFGLTRPAPGVGTTTVKSSSGSIVSVAAMGKPIMIFGSPKDHVSPADLREAVRAGTNQFKDLQAHADQLRVATTAAFIAAAAAAAEPGEDKAKSQRKREWADKLEQKWKETQKKADEKWKELEALKQKLVLVEAQKVIFEGDVIKAPQALPKRRR